MHKNLLSTQLSDWHIKKKKKSGIYVFNFVLEKEIYFGAFNWHLGKTRGGGLTSIRDWVLMDTEHSVNKEKDIYA